MPILSCDFETLDEGFESQSNVSETAESTPQTCHSNKQLPNSIKSTQNLTNQQKTNLSTKQRTPFVEKLRSISTNNIITRNVQRCAVSRRITVEKEAEETHSISSTPPTQSQLPIATHRISSNKSKTTIRHINSALNSSSFARPLRAFQMSPVIANASSSSPKITRKTSSTSQHHVTIQKTLVGRTILATVLPPPTFNTNHKNN
jgi:hypothetical protein